MFGVTSIVALAFWVGVQARTVAELKDQLNTRGGPAVSMEADRRLTLVEERQNNVLRKLERIDMIDAEQNDRLYQVEKLLMLNKGNKQ